MKRKVVLSNRIYVEGATPQEIDIFQTTLKYSITKRVGAHKYTTTINNFVRVSDTVVSLPAGRQDLLDLSTYEVIDKRTLVPVEFPRFRGSLRPAQQEFYDLVEDSYLLNAPPSWGKTFSALSVAAKLGQKTLIVTHTGMLRDQWVSEIDRVFGIKASVVGSGAFDISSIITVGNVQTVTKHMANLADKFGTLILDETHHVAATTFSSIVDKSKARYKIGLSGTLIRKDGRHVTFPDYFGHDVFKPAKENCLIPQVVVVDTDIYLKPQKFWANTITELENYNPEYRKLVVELATNAASKGYKVLVVGSRVEFLSRAAEQTPRAASITGKISNMDERNSILAKVGTGELDVIYGTLSIFSEGISQNDLSCLILATPTNNEPMLTQLVGRIIRESPGKKQPLIIDIKLKNNTMSRQANVRMGVYMREGYQVRILKK